MLENKDMAKQTKFEKVDIQNFLGDSKLNNIALHSIIAKIADNNPTIILGIESLLTEKITELTEHLKSNPKDFQGRRGLLQMVGKRKRFLSYIKDRNLEEYRALIKKLKIRG